MNPAPPRAGEAIDAPPASGSVLVVRPSSLGDVVYALAIAADIARARPGTAIDWVAEEAFAELPRLCTAVRRTIPVAMRRWRGSLLSPATWREMSAFRRDLSAQRYDAVLDLQEQVKGALIARLARGPRHGLHRSSIREPVATLLHDIHHVVPVDVHFLVKCRRLAAAALDYALPPDPRWCLAPAPRVGAMPDAPYAVAVTMTSRADKLWPEERWRAVLSDLAQAGLRVLLPWGSATERERSERLASGIGGAIVPPRQTLTDLAALLAHAEIAIGVDTGLTHLAAALGTPTVALFTSTDPALAGVWVTGPHARDLGGNGVVPTSSHARSACAALLRASPTH